MQSTLIVKSFCKTHSHTDYWFLVFPGSLCIHSLQFMPPERKESERESEQEVRCENTVCVIQYMEWLCWKHDHETSFMRPKKYIVYRFSLWNAMIVVFEPYRCQFISNLSVDQTYIRVDRGDEAIYYFFFNGDLHLTVW